MPIKLHITFPSPIGEELAARLQRLGYDVSRDLNILLFSAAATQVPASVAVILAQVPGITDADVVEATKRIRLARPDMRLIFVHGERNAPLISALIGLGVYDHHVVEEFDERCIASWIERPMTFADAHALISDGGGESPVVHANIRDAPSAPSVGDAPEARPAGPARRERKKPARESKTKGEGGVISRIFRILFPSPRRGGVAEKISREEDLYEPEDLDDLFGEPGKERGGEKASQVLRNTFATTGSSRQPYAVSIYSGTKGSTGKTTISLALAAYLAGLGHKVALVDADRASFGASILLFGDRIVQPRKSRIIRGATLYPAEALDRGLESISADIVLVDFGAVLSERDREILLHSDLVLVVSLPETATVSIIRRHMKTVGVRNARLVLNRYLPGEGLPPWEVSRAMDLPLLETIPFDLESLEEAHARQVSVLEIRGNKFAEPIAKIAQRILAEVPKHEQGGIYG